MSEHSLWVRMRDAIGHTGHWDRREYNPIEGVPDLNYCVGGYEGHIELKHELPPARADTAVFGPRTPKGMRDSQLAWFRRRELAKGRCYVLAQVGARLYLMHGEHARVFNEMTVADFEQLALWKAGPRIEAFDWALFITVICNPVFNWPKATRDRIQITTSAPAKDGGGRVHRSGGGRQVSERRNPAKESSQLKPASRKKV